MSTKVAVITGGNKGIGYAMVKGLCKRFSGHVYLTARDVDKGELACKEIQKHGYNPKFHQLDISDQNSVDKFQKYLKTKYGGIDILINNAGVIFWDGPNEVMEKAEETIDVNYFGLLRICNSLFPLLKPYSRVVNMSSSTGHLSRIPCLNIRQKFTQTNLTIEELSTLMNEFVRSVKEGRNIKDGWGSSAYAVSKIGVTALTKIQQREINKDLLKTGTLINCVHPGYCLTELTQNKGHMSVEQGAETPLYLALLPKKEDNIKGAYVWYNKEIINWASTIPPILPTGHILPLRT